MRSAQILLFTVNQHDSAAAARAVDHRQAGGDHDAPGRDVHLHRHASRRDVQVLARRRAGHAVHVADHVLEPRRDRPLLHGGRRTTALNQASPATQYCWTITSIEFTISGAPYGDFSPGKHQLIDLEITNPNDFDIKVTGVNVTIADATTKDALPNPGCIGSQNLLVSQSFSGTVTVPANSTVTVPDAQSPELTMPNLSTNQDACKGTSFQIHYTGTAILP